MGVVELCVASPRVIVTGSLLIVFTLWALMVTCNGNKLSLRSPSSSMASVPATEMSASELGSALTVGSSWDERCVLRW